MELEFKRQDGSWIPCSISLSSANPPLGIIISCENSKEEEINQIVSNKEDILAQLRYRSAFLQDGECSKIKAKEHVLAMHNDNLSENLFFDAIVEKINKVRHSDRSLCRCTFELRFLSPHIKNQTVKVRSNCIMRLSEKEIETHAVFKAFLEAPTTPRAKLEFPQVVSPFIENEEELSFSLEKQVEEISKLAEGIDCTNDCIIGVKKANQNGERRSTRSQIKQEIKIPETKAVNEVNSTCFLSPLGARAALASSLFTEFPGIQKKLDFMVSQTDTEVVFLDSEKPVSKKSDSGKSSPDVPRRATRSEVVYLDSKKPVSKKSGSEKSSPDVPRRATRSEVVFLDSEKLVSKKSGYEKSSPDVPRRATRSKVVFLDSEKPVSKKSGSEKSSPDVPRRATRSSAKRTVDNNTINKEENENEIMNGTDSENGRNKKKKIVVVKTIPTRSSPRLSSLSKN